MECVWCKEQFEPIEGGFEKDMGFLCETCISAISSRGETLEFVENEEDKNNGGIKNG